MKLIRNAVNNPSAGFPNQWIRAINNILDRESWTINSVINSHVFEDDDYPGQLIDSLDFRSAYEIRKSIAAVIRWAPFWWFYGPDGKCRTDDPHNDFEITCQRILNRLNHPRDIIYNLLKETDEDMQEFIKEGLLPSDASFHFDKVMMNLNNASDLAPNGYGPFNIDDWQGMGVKVEGNGNVLCLFKLRSDSNIRGLILPQNSVRTNESDGYCFKSYDQVYHAELKRLNLYNLKEIFHKHKNRCFHDRKYYESWKTYEASCHDYSCATGHATDNLVFKDSSFAIGFTSSDISKDNRTDNWINYNDAIDSNWWNHYREGLIYFDRNNRPIGMSFGPSGRRGGLITFAYYHELWVLVLNLQEYGFFDGTISYSYDVPEFYVDDMSNECGWLKSNNDPTTTPPTTTPSIDTTSPPLIDTRFRGSYKDDNYTYISYLCPPNMTPGEYSPTCNVPVYETRTLRCGIFNGYVELAYFLFL